MPLHRSTSHYQNTYFLLSAADVKQLPADQGIEIAIVGRSNAGKSSVLNKMTRMKGLARVSKTPGRTQHINLFIIDEKRRIADLPGYGYAKVPPQMKIKWQKTVNTYITTRDALKGLILVMDIRHPLKPMDWQLLTYCQTRELPVHILLNKADKLSRGQAAQTLKVVQATLAEAHYDASCQCFSALKGAGLKELDAVLNEWYMFDY